MSGHGHGHGHDHVYDHDDVCDHRFLATLAGCGRSARWNMLDSLHFAG